MKNNKKRNSRITRRKFLPFLGGGILFPFFGSARSVEKLVDSDGGKYETLLTKDGKVVKVRTGAINDSEVIKTQLSNKSLLSWLKKDNPTT